MRTSLRKIGNSQGILIPKPMLLQAGLEAEIDLNVEDGALVLRPAQSTKPRAGWAEAARQLTGTDDTLETWPALANLDDAELKW